MLDELDLVSALSLLIIERSSEALQFLEELGMQQNCEVYGMGIDPF